jgi:hypothetical protein
MRVDSFGFALGCYRFRCRAKGYLIKQNLAAPLRLWNRLRKFKLHSPTVLAGRESLPSYQRDFMRYTLLSMEGAVNSTLWDLGTGSEEMRQTKWALQPG